MLRQNCTLNWTLDGLPASAAVERLFSLVGRVFSPLRSKLSSEHFEMMLFMRCVKLWIAAAETLVSLGTRVSPISPLWFRLNIEGFDFFCCDKYTGDTYVYVYVIKKVLFKKYWYRYWQYFFHEVLVLVSAILSKSIVNNPATVVVLALGLFKQPLVQSRPFFILCQRRERISHKFL